MHRGGSTPGSLVKWEPRAANGRPYLLLIGLRKNREIATPVCYIKV